MVTHTDPQAQIKKNLIIVLFLVGIVVLIIYTLLQLSPTQKEYPKAFMYGLEDGDCLVPLINLWDKPGGIGAGANVVGTLDGCIGMPVEIIDQKTISSRTFYHVRTYGASAGKSGWVADSLIKKV